MRKKTKTLTIKQGNSFNRGVFSRPSKDTKLNGNDLRVLDLLSKGVYNAIQISALLKLPDPRSNIRYLRNAGYNIGDYWAKTAYSRCKFYFVKKTGGIK